MNEQPWIQNWLCDMDGVLINDGAMIEGADQLRLLGQCVLWEGAQDILFEAL